MSLVLITSGSDEDTWYFGQQGSVFEVDDISYSVYLIKGDHFRGVRKEDGELLYTEAEYNEVREQRDKAIDDLAKHAKEMADLRHERQMLLETIERAAGEQELVELPRDVAGAIEYFKDDGDDIDDIIRLLVNNWASERLTVLRGYATYHGFEFISALVNGYTIKQTPTERFQADVQNLLKDWLGSNLDEKLIDQLASQIVEHAQQLQT